MTATGCKQVDAHSQNHTVCFCHHKRDKLAVTDNNDDFKYE